MKKRLKKYMLVLASVSLAWCVLEAGPVLAQKKVLNGNGDSVVVTAEQEEKDQTRDGIEKITMDVDMTEDEFGNGRMYIQIPEIVVMWDDPAQEIPSMAGGYTLVRESREWKDENGEPLTETMIACGEDPLSVLWEKNDDLPYVDLGRWITVNFRNGSMPDYIYIEDMVLDENGAAKYDAESYDSDDVIIVGNTLGFSLTPNMNALYSTDSSTYKKGGVTRGIRLTCVWKNGSKAEYAWIIKTDAVYDSDGHTGYGSTTPAGCGTGIPVTSGMESLKKTSNGYVMKMQIYNHYRDPYTINDEFTVARLQGDERIELELREGRSFNGKYKKLGFWNSAPKMDIGKYYGELEPGYYVLYKELINQETGGTYPLTRGFVIVE